MTPSWTDTERLELATRNLAAFVNCDLGTDFRTYGARLRRAPSTYVRAIADYVLLTGRNAHGPVLDACPGYGFETVVLGSLLSSRMAALDIRPDHLSALRGGLKALDGKLTAAGIDVTQGDIARTPYEDGTFAWILCREAIEHIHDLAAFFREAWRILRPGGCLICTDDSSWLHPPTRKRIQRMWRRRDSDPTYLEELRRVRPQDNKSTRPYLDMRRDTIRSEFPHLPEEQVRDLARRTMGLVRDEVIESVSLALAGKPMLQPDRKALARDPETGEYCERLLDPFEVREAAREAGFEVSLRPDSHTHLRWFLFHESRLLNPLLFRMKPGFVVFATRPE